MSRIIALIKADTCLSAIGTPSGVTRNVSGQAVLRRVVQRIACVERVEAIVIVHPIESQVSEIQQCLDGLSVEIPLEMFAFSATDADAFQASRIAGRKWSLNSWRGGIGAATCYDELLPAGPLANAMVQFDAASAILVGGDWPLVDPSLCSRVLSRHLEAPDTMQMVFTQSPPGLCGVALSLALLKQLAQNEIGFNQVFGYVPTRAQADPIGLDVCVQIPAVVRDCPHRFIYDTQQSMDLIDSICTDSDELIEHRTSQQTVAFANQKMSTAGARVEQAMASASVGASMNSTVGSLCAEEVESSGIPAQVTIELAPQRSVLGKLTPQHYVELSRSPMGTSLAKKIIDQLGEPYQTCVTFGGLGDALLHPDWLELVEYAASVSTFAIAIETDLLVDAVALDQLLDAPIDVISVRLNADTAGVYEQAMGEDHFKLVTDNIQNLLLGRAERTKLGERAGLPWIVPRMVKTAETLPDMETYFDRWMHFAGHAVIEPSVSGRSIAGDLMQSQSPVLMAPPKRVACRQLANRMAILSDGRVALCDQDWIGDGSVGDSATTSIGGLWSKIQSVEKQHACDRWQENILCKGCHEWHRP